MNANERRQKITEKLKFSVGPITGAALAAEMGVSRQIIVTDIALLRSSGLSIYATPDGYVLPAMPSMEPSRIIAACHIGDGPMRDELETIVSLGGTVVDVSIEHKIYGEFRATLLIHDQAGVDSFVSRMQESGMSPMSLITGGVHLHTISAKDEQTLDRIESALRQKGYLVSEQD